MIAYGCTVPVCMDVQMEEALMKGRSNMWYNFSLISQLAISFLTPIFLMIFVCIQLKNRFGFGDWVIISGMLLGIGSGLSSVWVYLKRSIKDAEQQQQEYEDQFR